MPIFFVNLIVAIILFLTSLNYEKKKDSLRWWIILFIPVLFFGLRYDTTSDYFNYVMFFNRVSNGSALSFEMEPGYYYLNVIFSKIPYGFTIIFFFASFLNFYSLQKFFSQNGVLAYGYLLSFCMGLVLMFNNQIRQGIALSIFLLSIPLILDGKFTKYLLITIIATLFHTSALSFLFFYFVIRWAKRASGRKSIYLFLSFVFLIVFFSGLLKPLISLLFTLNEHYSRFVGSSYDVSTNFHSIGPVFIFNLFLMLYVICNRKCFNGQNIIFYNMTFVVIILYCVFAIIPVTERIVRYIYPFEYVALSIIFQSRIMKQRSINNVFSGFILFSTIVYGIYCSYQDNYGGIHKTVFSEDCENGLFYDRHWSDGTGKNNRSDQISIYGDSYKTQK